MVDFLDEENVEMLADKELQKLYAAMSKLTERQMEVVQRLKKHMSWISRCAICRSLGVWLNCF